MFKIPLNVDQKERCLRAIDLVVVTAATASGEPVAPLLPAGDQRQERSGFD